MTTSQNNSPTPQVCASVRREFSAYLDGAVSGVAMHAIAGHLDTCSTCAGEFRDLRDLQATLSSMGPAKAPAGLQARLRAVIAMERERGTNLSLAHRLGSIWKTRLAPIAWRFAAGTAAALVLVGGLGLLLVVADTPAAVQANDEPLGAMTVPHYLYSEVPPQPIEFGRQVPVLIEAKVDKQGRVYDYTILSGPTDPSVERRVQANLLASVFQPATVFGVPVAGRVMMTYTGVSVRG